MMSVLIDDSDPLVQYSSPQWTAKGQAPEFEVTAHASGTPGDTATLAFEGTSISVYGSIAGSDGYSRLNFSIDGVPVGYFTAPEVPRAIHNTLFWTSPDYPEGSHQLLVTVDEDSSTNPSDRTFFLDYFVYQTTSAAGKTMLFDDTDASVTYSPGWQARNHSDSSLEGTEHVSESAGSSVALSFEGAQISLFGSFQNSFAGSFAIDASPPTMISSSQNQNPFFNFSSPMLSPGSHTINFTVLTGNSVAVDYFLVTPQPATSTGLPAADGRQSATQVSKPPPVAAIVGGVVGGLVLLLLLLLAVLLWKRRARRVQGAFHGYFQRKL
ncbi:hypothetical protein B0H19DRAFT_1111070 [Mycena capillaripes]|nr:hypothetical protein B0H19DRAFT_1111070 [Mycena capillaripes]